MKQRYKGFDLFWSYPALPKMPLKFFYHRDYRFPDNNGKLLVVPDSLDIKNLSSQLMSIKKELDSLRENSSDLTQSVRKVAKLIRNELKTTHTKEDLSWPPNPEELDKDYLSLTPFATLFLTTLISGDPDKAVTSHIQRLVLSIFQDCCE